MTNWFLWTPTLWADEWNNFHRLLISEDLWQTIFSRYNQHPNYLINGIYAVSLYWLGGSTLLFKIITITSILATIILLSHRLFISLWETSLLTEKIAIALVGLNCAISMVNKEVLFWSVGYLSILTSLIAIYGLSIYGDQKKFGPLAMFFFGAILLNISFGSGLAIWPILPITMFLKREKPHIKVISLVVGVIGFWFSISGLISSNTAIKPSTIIDKISAQLLYIGSPIALPVEVFLGRLAMQPILLLSGGLGIGFFIYLLKKSLSKTTLTGLETFSILLCLFVIEVGILIVLSRLEYGFSGMYAGRYVCWSSLFWIGLLFLWMEGVLIKKTKNGTKLLLRVSLIISIAVSLTNLFYTSIRLPVYDLSLRAQADLIVNPDTYGNERLIWQSRGEYPVLRKKILFTDSIFMAQKKGNYRDGHQNRLDQILHEKHRIAEQTIKGEYKLSADEFGNYVQVSIKKDAQKNINKKYIYITHNGLITGIAYKSSSRFLQDNKIKTLLWPYAYFPQFSNVYIGQYKLENPSGNKNTDIELYSINSEGRAIKIIQ